MKKNGMIPGIWFEFETVGEDSIAFSYVDHLLKKDGFPLTIGKRRFWDMNDPWVIDYLEKKIIDFLQKYVFGYLKIDYNETIGIGADGAESYGEKLRQQLAGTQTFIQKIKNRLPDLIIESCSSGGHRLEPSMMSLSDLSSFSDAHEADSIPIIAANLHHLLLPRQSLIWAVLRENDSQQRLYYSLISTFLGRMCLSGDIEKLSDVQWKIVDQAIQFYKSIVPIIKYGITERLGNLPLSYQRMSGHQILKRQREEKLLVVIHFFDEMEVFVPTSFQTIVASFGLEDQKMSLKRTEKGFFIVSPYQMTACALLLKK
ncbi:glycoside hydrolase family 36 protein [Enterococcus camelliae]|uniref:Glycoside hydrolase family 36 protein n=1 Tax=Enterococcus camelliae TaxID=453959 RepID=A0ABW5TH22_9ENTE